MKKFLVAFVVLFLLSGCTSPNLEKKTPSSSLPTTEIPAREKDDSYSNEEAELQADLPLEKISLPSGFHIGLFAANVDGARSLSLSDTGILYVGTRNPGKVYALEDR